MSSRNKKSGYLIGAAALAGVLGTLTSLLIPKKNKKWTQQAKETAQAAIDHWHPQDHASWILGGAAGSLIGVTTALLLAPKSGSELRQDLLDALPLHDESHKRRGGSSRKKSSRATPKSIARALAKKTKRVTGGSKRSASSKKSRSSKKAKATQSHAAEHKTNHHAAHHHEEKASHHSISSSS